MTELSKNLLSLRKKNNLTGRQVADYLGINLGSYGHWERGHVGNPPIQHLQKLCKLYGVDKVETLYAQECDASKAKHSQEFKLFKAFQFAPKHIQKAVSVLLEMEK